MDQYAPYSDSRETCLVRGKSGMIYPGVRVENISYPLTITSIQAAVCSCLANGDIPQSYSLTNGSNRPELLSFWTTTFNLEELERYGTDEPRFNPLIPVESNIGVELTALCSKAVTIHSGFPVSSLLKVADGYIPGANVEVEAWALGLCAERVSISRAIAAGYTEFESIHVHAPKSDFSSPCGACRQVLNEFMPSGVVEMHHGDGSLSKHITSHLLPHGFISEELTRKK